MSLAVTDVGSGRPILLVHGQPGSRADWSRLIPLLAGDHRVLAVDRPGYGESGGEAVGLLENASLLGRLLEDRSALGRRSSATRSAPGSRSRWPSSRWAPAHSC